MIGRRQFFACLWTALQWQPPWIFDIVVSSVLGAAVGIWAGHYTDAFSKPPPKIATIWTNDQGQARPMMTLIPPLRRDNRVSIRFHPPELEKVVVCEFSRIGGNTPDEIMLAYLAKYPMCFSVTEKEQGVEWIVRPNTIFKQMKLKDGQWSCLCG
jgi:hypothetical protein